MTFKCDGCGKRNFQPAPMLRDEVWRELADERATLCDGCMWRRQRERHVSITLNSLKPCPVNLIKWFDLFAALLNEPPENITEWRPFALDPKVASWVLSRRYGRPLHPWIDPDGAAPRARKQFAEWLDEQEAARNEAQP